MKRNAKHLILLASASMLLPLMSGCQSSSAGDVIYLRVLNSDDYIGDDLGEDGLEPFWESEYSGFSSVLDAFEAYEKEVNNKEVRIIYETFDTNETMLSSLKTGKSTYDLVCPSDYAIQKMMSTGMLEPFSKENTPTYDTYVSRYLKSQMEGITATIGDGSEDLHPIDEYAKGYMWGTLGVLYNPAKVAADKGLSEDEVKWDMSEWTSLWDEKYHGEMSIKDSMRDTYSVGIMGLFDEELRKIIADSGCFDEDFNLLEGKFDEAMEKYNPLLSEIFNRCDEENVKKVEDILLKLKGNVFGFEVDSGKDDIVKGLVGMNLAWSGDAVYSLDRGDNEGNQEIFYAIPKTGGNIWFDGWCMPKSDSLHKEEAEEFVDFLSNPAIASANMSAVGYSSFVAGDYVLDLVRDWYDPRSYEMYVYHDASNDPGCTWEDSDFVYDEEGERVLKDGTGIHEDGDDYGDIDMSKTIEIDGEEVGSSYERAVIVNENEEIVSLSWEEYQTYYNENIAESEDDYLEWKTVNLTYMFDGTLEEDLPDTLGDTPETNPYLFYDDVTETIENPYEDDGRTIEAGRQFFAQYPPEDLIPKLAIMKDYGTNNKYVLTMWENVKSNNLPIWGVVVFGIILAAALALGGSAFFARYAIKKQRKARKGESK
ncbi:MAG: extracellular solute-binding protein [Bacilli bacterium]|nr:extracellular solute-binding protein [Bacilli bacterium]